MGNIGDILSKCCAKEQGMYNLVLPFVQGGYLYGTDAHIAIRVSSDLPDTQVEGCLPKMTQLNWAFDTGWRQWMGYPVVPATTKQCDYCCGTKKQVAFYEDDGCEVEVPCHECDEACQIADVPAHAIIPGLKAECAMAGKYADIINELSGDGLVEYAIAEWHDCQMVHFRAGALRGMVTTINVEASIGDTVEGGR